MFRKDDRNESGITLVAPNCELVGDVYFNDQLIVDGIVKGNIYARAGSKAKVTISEKGWVSGEIHVPDVIVNGRVSGDIRSDRHIELAAKAEVEGQVYYRLLEMVQGSRVDGRLIYVREGKQEAGEARPSKPAVESQDGSPAPAVAAVANPSAGA